MNTKTTDIVPPTDREKKERENCPACKAKRYHTEQEWKNHPRRGTGQDARIAPHK